MKNPTDLLRDIVHGVAQATAELIAEEYEDMALLMAEREAVADQIQEATFEAGTEEPDTDLARLLLHTEATTSALKEALADVCEMHCPSVKRTGEDWTHSEKCVRLHASIGENPTP